MEIRMIGTGSIGARSRSASTLIDNRILIDCGNGIIKTISSYGISVKDIDVILITHLHGDHFLDIPFILFQRIFDDATNELKIYGPIGTKDTLKQLFELAYKGSNYEDKLEQANIDIIDYEVLDNDEVLPNYYVTSKEVEHGDFKPAYGFIIKHDNHSIGISGDSSYCPSVIELAKNSDISILDTTFISGNLKHMGLDNIETLIYTYHKRIIPTHMDDLTRLEIQKRNIDNLILLNDGDIYNI
jgi:ribonuclease BN (tRNA processing enzyme)